MKLDISIALLDKQITSAQGLMASPSITHDKYEAWSSASKHILEEAFGQKSTQMRDFIGRISLAALQGSTHDQDRERMRTLQSRVAVLQSLLDLLRERQALEQRQTASPLPGQHAEASDRDASSSAEHKGLVGEVEVIRDLIDKRERDSQILTHVRTALSYLNDLWTPPGGAVRGDYHRLKDHLPELVKQRRYEDLLSELQAQITRTATLSHVTSTTSAQRELGTQSDASHTDPSKLPVGQLLKSMTLGQMWAMGGSVIALMIGAFLFGHFLDSGRTELQVEDLRLCLTRSTEEASATGQALKRSNDKERFLALYVEYLKATDSTDNDKMLVALRDLTSFVDQLASDAAVRIHKGDGQRNTVAFTDGTTWTIPQLSGSTNKP